MAGTINLRVPDDVHVVICRGNKAADRADHEIINTHDLQIFLEAHILRHIRAHYNSPSTFQWKGPEDWRIFLQGEAARATVTLENKESFTVTLRKSKDSRVIYLNR
jgi:hypothetical protein